MRVGFVLLDGFDILSAVSKLSKVMAEVIEREVTTKNIFQEKYTINLTFNEILNGTWSLEFYSIKGDLDNSKRIKITWYYALNDENADNKYPEGKLSRKFIAEYFIIYEEEKKDENNIKDKKEEEIVIEEKKELKADSKVNKDN